MRAGSQKRKACHSCGLDFQFQQPALSQKPIYASDYGLTPESTPREMRQMKQDIMQAIRELVEENPPFPIKHDQPHKQSAVDRHRAERLETIHHQEEAAAEQAAKEQQE